MAITSFPIETIELTAVHPNIFYTSQHGMVSDADLSFYSSNKGTDNTAAFDAILGNASGTIAILVIVDGQYGLNQIRIRSNTYIKVLPGCGFIQRDNADVQFIANYNRSKSAYANSNITIDGGTWNGNGWNGTTWNMEKVNTETIGGVVVGGYNFMMAWAGVDNLKVKNAEFINNRAYIGYTTYSKNILFDNVRLEVAATTPYGNLDGIDFVGNCQNVVLRNLNVKCKDDCFAFGGNYGWQSDDINGTFTDNSQTYSSWYMFATTGAVTDCLVDGVFFNDSYMGFRMLSTDGLIDNITIRNLRGRINGSMLAIIDNYTMGGSTPTGGMINTPSGNYEGNIGRLLIEDINVDMPNTFNTGGQGGAIYVGCKIAELTIRNWHRHEDTANPTNVARSINFGANCNIRRFLIDGFYYKYTTTAHEVFEMIGSARVWEMQLRNIMIDRLEAASFEAAPVLVNSNGNLHHLQVSGVVMRNCTAAIYLSSATTLESVQVANCAVLNKNVSGTAATDTHGFVKVVTVTLAKLTMSNFDGTLTHSGNVTLTKGDAFL